MSYKKFDDNFNSIIKSLKPIKIRFSKQSLRHDKLFKKSSFETIEKNLNGPKKSPESFQSSKLYKKIDYIYNVSNNTYDYFEDLKGVKNIPININKKGYNFVKNLYNPEFEVKPEERYFFNDNNANRPIFDAKRFNRSNKIFKFEVYALDPGYYHPNYNYIKKRIPSIIFNKSRSIHEYKTTKSIDDNNKKNNNNNNDKDNNTYNYNDIVSNENTINQNITNQTNKTKIEKEKITNLYNNENENEEIGITEEVKKDTRNIHMFHFNITSKKYKPITNDGGIKKIKKVNLPKIRRVTSQNNISTPIMISFNKMIGRNKKKTHKVKIQREEFDYNPNYSCTLPHVRSVSFKSDRNKQDHKKYIVNKILRSYCFNSNDYYVFDCKKNTKNTKNKL